LQVVVSQMKLAQKTVRKVISLKEKVAHIIKLLTNNIELKLGSLFSPQSRAEAVVTFLAVLELVKERHADVRQDGLFEEIAITKCKS